MDTTPSRNAISSFFSMRKISLFLIFFFVSHILLMEIMPQKTKQGSQSAKESFSDNNNNTTNPRGTAIVYLTKALDECKAIRLDHLLQTAPPDVDVWFLHNHNIMTNEMEQSKLNESLDHLRQLERDHFLYSESQANIHVQRFDTNTSGASKSSFLRWAVQHQEYNHVWQIEDDVLFTGEWSHFFAHADAEADFVGRRVQDKKKWYHWEEDRCTLAQNYLPPEIQKRLVRRLNTTLEERIFCRDVLSWRGTWSIIRVSTRLAQFLLDDLESGALQGHHEAVLHGLQMGHVNLTFKELPLLVGSNEAGSWGRYLNRSACSLEMYQPVQHNRLYHPLKCEAYAGVDKLDLFKEIMKTYGWSNRTLRSK
jgi:hypothetical protein